MSDIGLIICVVLVGAAFIIAWRKGLFVQITNYVDQMKQEMLKCTWPTWQELKESTILISITIALMGAFTVVVDQVFFYLVILISRA